MEIKKLITGSVIGLGDYTGPAGEMIYDPAANQIKVHDGQTVGGVPIAGPTANDIQQLINEVLDNLTLDGGGV
jgi:hypothetical protein